MLRSSYKLVTKFWKFLHHLNLTLSELKTWMSWERLLMPSANPNTKTASSSTIHTSCQSWKEYIKFLWMKRIAKWEKPVSPFSIWSPTPSEESLKQSLTISSVKFLMLASCGNQRKRAKKANSVWTQTANNKWMPFPQTRSQHTTKKLQPFTLWENLPKPAQSNSLLISKERIKSCKKTTNSSTKISESKFVSATQT